MQMQSRSVGSTRDKEWLHPYLIAQGMPDMAIRDNRSEYEAIYNFLHLVISCNGGIFIQIMYIFPYTFISI